VARLRSRAAPAVDVAPRGGAGVGRAVDRSPPASPAAGADECRARGVADGRQPPGLLGDPRVDLRRQRRERPARRAGPCRLQRRGAAHGRHRTGSRLAASGGPDRHRRHRPRSDRTAPRPRQIRGPHRSARGAPCHPRGRSRRSAHRHGIRRIAGRRRSALERPAVGRDGDRGGARTAPAAAAAPPRASYRRVRQFPLRLRDRRSDDRPGR
jgi:hypothetical protein